MKKSQIGSIIAAAVLTGWLFNIFPGRFLAAKLSTWPLLNRWQILSPQAPIVINNRETVRVEGSGDVLQAAGSVKSKISTLVEISRMTGSLLAVHSAVNLTSDGSFVTAESSFHNNNAFYVVLNDGRQTRVTRTSLDPATSLVFFKADLDNVPVANLAGSKDLSAGDKVIFVQNSLQNYYNRIFAEDVNFSESDVAGRTFKSDYPGRGFGAAAGQPLANGEAVVNTNGDIVGIWNGDEIVSSDVLKQAAGLYFNNQQKISRPSFGFNYSIITKNEASLTNSLQGAKVLQVAPGSPVQKAGLVAGDLISAVDSHPINENSTLEEILEKYKPGDKLTIIVTRKNQAVNLNLVAGELK